MTALLLLAAMVGASPALPAADAEGLYREGVQAFRAGDLVVAVRYLEEASAAAPTSVSIAFALGQACQARFNAVGTHYRQAVEAYGRVIEALSPDTPPSHPRQRARVLLAQLLIRGGEFRRALELLREFLEVCPDDAARDEVWNAVGVAHYYLNEYEEAVRAFERALRTTPTFSPARFNLRSVFTRLSLFDVAMANRRNGRLDLALAGLDRLLSVAPRYLPARLQRALILREIGRRAEAEEEALRALGLGSQPQSCFGLRELLGDLQAEAGRPWEALFHYRKCLEIFPGYVQVVEKIDALERAAPRAPLTDGADRSPIEPPPPAPLTQFPM